MNVCYKNFMRGLLFSIILCCVVSCAPQLHYMNVDVRRQAKVSLPEERSSAVFSIIGSGKYDSVRLGNVAAGLAEKIEEDRGRRSGTVTVWSVDENNFPGFPGEGGEKLSGESRKYLSGLSDLSGADLLFFVSRLRFLPYSVQVNSAYSQYDGNNVTLPFEVDFNIYDTEQELLLYSNRATDTLYLFVDGAISSRDMGSAIAKYLPDISKKIGTMLGKDVSSQWITQERLIISYEGDIQWEEARQLAFDFKWEEAIAKWTELVETKNPRKSACAAYNIALGCEMLEGFDLARKWIDYSLKIYPTKEAVAFKRYLENEKSPMGK